LAFIAKRVLAFIAKRVSALIATRVLAFIAMQKRVSLNRPHKCVFVCPIRTPGRALEESL
jgi:hypothetical protein